MQPLDYDDLAERRAARADDADLPSMSLSRTVGIARRFDRRRRLPLININPWPRPA